MPETPKKEPVIQENKHEKPGTSTWEDDQKRREYYYDDAHGYEKYEPETDELDDIEMESLSRSDA